MATENGLVTTAVGNQRTYEFLGNPSESLAEVIDVASASATYVCQAPYGSATSAAVWSCKKITTTGNVQQITWADGGKFSQIAANRASLTYA